MSAPHRPMRVAMLGECMLELRSDALESSAMAMGGDTWNTAVYLARCTAPARLQICYATAVGIDRLSDRLLRRSADEGLSLDLVRRISGRLPGIYMIDVDATGERSFSFWRQQSAAREYFDVAQTPLEESAAELDLLYFSGITLAILPMAAQARLFRMVEHLRERGAQVVFDNNFRSHLWADKAAARSAFRQAYGWASTAMVTLDDHRALFGHETMQQALEDAQGLEPRELIIKQGARPVLVRAFEGDDWSSVPTCTLSEVADTTAAGDSFAAGYLSRRLLGQTAVESARFGNLLAARVIQYPGAVIDRSVMTDLMQAMP